MGATSFSIVSFGTDAGAVYKRLQDEAERVYGHQEGYSGQINCARGALRKANIYGVKSDELLKMKQESQKKELRRLRIGDFPDAMEIMRANDHALCMRSNDEGSVFCVDFGIVYYVSQRMQRKTLSKRRFDTYDILDENGSFITRIGGIYESSFDRKMTELATKMGSGEYTLVGYLKNTTCVPVWKYTFTRTESRRQSNGCIPIHAYWYVGWASE